MREQAKGICEALTISGSKIKRMPSHGSYFPNLKKKPNIYVISVNNPTITEPNSATEYTIGGASLTLTCTSTSGSGTYAWKLGGTVVYVTLIIFLWSILFLDSVAAQLNSVIYVTV